MNKIFLIITVTLFISSVANANELKGKALNELSGKISEYTIGLIPGEGTTEFDIQLSDKDNNEPRINFLILRDLNKKIKSNFFSQMSLHTQDNGLSDKRYTGNIGYGYRQLSNDNLYMLGANIFYDRDLKEGHSRASIGLEAKAGIIDFNFNHYEALSLQKGVKGNKEQALGGMDYTLATQLPYIPWAKFNFTGYTHNADLASVDTKGKKYTAEMNLTSSLIFEAEYDKSGNSGDDYTSARITFVYPPRISNPSLVDGFLSSQAFYKKDMTKTLSEKVKRNNNIVIETQGAVIVTVQ
tara:strand:+ start:30 stop:920 length:891 start_codon:yes stop_codon:yes gene_type:complete